MSLDSSLTQLRNFLPLAKLGQGTFSTVYKVKRIHDGEVYALKKIKMQKLNQKEQQNALNQIRILASLKSNFIISYKEAFYDQSLNLLCIVMEYAEDGDLQKSISDHLKAKTKFKQEQIWKAACQILLGLFILHEKDILHRDLKSANVFVSNKNYKLGDLNVSKICNDQMAKTQTGTPYYASPEVWRDEIYDSKCDIWSFGCLLYEMCCLEPPFQGCDLDELFRTVQKGQYRSIPVEYSLQLARLIKFCLIVDPKQRFSTKQLIRQFPFLNQRFLQSLRNQQIQSDIPFLSTIRLPSNLKDLTKSLPLPDYDESLKQCPKTAYHKAENKETMMLRDKNVLEKEKIIPLPERIKGYFKQHQIPLKKRPQRPYTSSKRPQKIEVKHELRPVSAVHCGSQRVNSPSRFSKKLKIVTGNQQLQAIKAKYNIRKQKALSVQTPKTQNRIQSCSPKNKPLHLNKHNPINLRQANKNQPKSSQQKYPKQSIYEQKLNDINTQLKEILPLNEKVYLQCKENSIKRISSLEKKVQHIREERKQRKNVLQKNKENAFSIRQQNMLKEGHLDMKEKLKQKIKQCSEVFSLKRYDNVPSLEVDLKKKNENGDYLKRNKADNLDHIQRHLNNRRKNLYYGRQVVSAQGKRDRSQLSLIQNKNHQQNQRKFGMIRQIPINILPSIRSERKTQKKDFDSQNYTKGFNKNPKTYESIEQQSFVDNSEAIIRLKKRIKNRMICQNILPRPYGVKESFSRNVSLNKFYY